MIGKGEFLMEIDDSIIKQVSLKEGLKIIEDARSLLLDGEWVGRRLWSYQNKCLSGQDDAPPISIKEHTGNMADLIVKYGFADGRRLVAKMFLPVIKSDPTFGFHGLEDRGNGIDVRMRMFAACLAVGGECRVPPAHCYDKECKILWMDNVGDRIRDLSIEDWPEALPRISRALKAVHGSKVADDHIMGTQIRRREMLISYPFRYLKSYFVTDGNRSEWDRFVELDKSCKPCLIHGDLCRKNIGISDGTIWFLDFERSNLASAAYDIGFFLSDCLLAMWDSDDKRLVQLLERFLDEYLDGDDGLNEFLYRVNRYMALVLAYRAAVPERIRITKPEILTSARSRIMTILNNKHFNLQSTCAFYLG